MKTNDLTNIKSENKNNKGITLVALIITIVIMMILAGISIGSATVSTDQIKLNEFYTELELIQKRVDAISATNESYIDNNNQVVYLKETGKILTTEQEAFIASLNKDFLPENFKYFTSNDLAEILQIINISRNVFIDFNNRIVISENGVEKDGVTHYMLEKSTYFVEYNENKNKGELDINLSIYKYGKSKYKVTVTPISNIGDIQGTGILKYKKSSSSYWKVADDLEFIVEDLTNYDIMYQDISNNIVQKTVSISLDDALEPKIELVVESEIRDDDM